jgi:hypothetical protein
VLTVNGVLVTINAPLSSPYLVVDYYISETPGTFQVRLLPGSHLFRAYGGGDDISFTVDARGKVSYDAALDQAGILSGQGSSVLTVNGALVTINAPLSSPYLVVDYYISEQPGTFQVRLLPGSHVFRAYGGGDDVSFTVDTGGKVNYDAALDQVGILSGQGSSVLTVNGVGVTINAQALSNPYLALDYYISETPGTFLVHLLPGSHLLQAYGGGSINFTIGQDGSISFDDPNLVQAGIVSVQNGNTLVVNGVRVAIDARLLSTSQVYLDYYTVEQTGSVFYVTLLPGTQRLQGYGGGEVDFRVTDQGVIDFDTSLDAALSGRGSQTLIVKALG